MTFYYTKTNGVRLKVLKPLCLILVLFFTTSCEDTDVGIMTGAGFDAIKAVTLSDSKVVELAQQAAGHVDSSNKIAPFGSPYNKRLHRLVGDHLEEDGHVFNYKVYLSPQVNAFAMADGTIRVNSALMDMLTNGELRFVIGHEMGHVVNKHIKKKMMMSYGGSALRKAIASQDNLAGEISRSILGSFAETLVNAQFSQQEERESDDYGLEFLIREEYDSQAAVSALRKLATLGAGHSFLSSHPAPDRRAQRLENRLSGENPESSPSFLQNMMIVLKKLWNLLVQLILSLL